MKNVKLLYKKINPHDYGKLLYEMDINAFNRNFDYPSPSIAMTLDYLKNCNVYLVYSNETVIGLFAFKDVDKKVEVKQIIVLSDYQHKGYGKEIIKEIFRINKNKSIWLVTHPKNTSAIILYLKNGFEITGWKNNYYGDNQPRIIFHFKNNLSD